MALRRTAATLIKTRSSVVPPRPIRDTASRRPLPVPEEPRGRDRIYSEYKQPFLIRPFIRDGNLAAMQHIEFAGMYRDELAIERFKHPRLRRTLTINTDGSLSEREFEVAAPPLMVLFQDRASLHRDRLNSIMSAALVDDLKASLNTWGAAAADQPDPEPVEETVCNALAHPYAVPVPLA
eukprot:CAMPEP_0174855234 /NCGR_PEP_ID=MMETSP1114-20130205/32785_1 /TAXON_ID=312471 /ORGANISM="Neobodo designis, Strain CCAP 1951/1" /LENGTH=179 /DNA_ID=CAMNT_0016089969 /DNA_START=34 /DNA_END=570 /DNA_ORIENTATION=+